MLGMSQEKLGESLGITFQQIQKYEKGYESRRRKPLAEHLEHPERSGFFLLRRCSRDTSSGQSGMAEASSSNMSSIFPVLVEGLQLNRPS